MMERNINTDTILVHNTTRQRTILPSAIFTWMSEQFDPYGQKSQGFTKDLQIVQIKSTVLLFTVDVI